MERTEVMLIATVVLLVSAVLNGLIRDDFTHIATVLFGVAAVLCLLVTIVLHARA